MARDIFCFHCQVLVGTIENGSLIRKGTIYICSKCTPKPTSDTPFIDKYMDEYGKDLFDVGNVFDNLFKGPKK